MASPTSARVELGTVMILLIGLGVTGSATLSQLRGAGSAASIDGFWRITKI
jgi:hypothetical protein